MLPPIHKWESFVIGVQVMDTQDTAAMSTVQIGLVQQDPCQATKTGIADCRRCFGFVQVCRPAAAGGCDVEETCDGVNNDCPPDKFSPVTTVMSSPTNCTSYIHIAYLLAHSRCGQAALAVPKVCKGSREGGLRLPGNVEQVPVHSPAHWSALVATCNLGVRQLQPPARNQCQTLMQLGNQSFR